MQTQIIKYTGEYHYLSDLGQFLRSQVEDYFKFETVLIQEEPLKFIEVDLLKGLLVIFKNEEFKIYKYNNISLLDTLKKLKDDFKEKGFYTSSVENRIKELKILIDSKKSNKIKELIKGNKKIKVGSFLYTSWGYDQTNNEFFIIKKILGKNYFIIQEVNTLRTESDGEPNAQYDCLTIKGDELNKLPIKAFISNDGYMSICETGYKRSLYMHEPGKTYTPTNPQFGH